MEREIRVRSDDGSEVAAYDFGGDGPAVLFGHATGFHAHLWLPVVARVRDRLHCYAWDARGHGRSGPPASGDYAWARSGDDARAVAAAFGLAAPMGVGHSGAGAAMILAEADHPGSWTRLWLFEPVVPEPPDPPEENPLVGIALRRRDHFDSRQAAVANFTPKPPFDTFTPEAVALYVEYGFVDDPEGGITLACRREDEAATYAEAMPAGARRRLPEVHRPVHVALGELTAHFPHESMVAAVDLLPQGELEVMAGLGHFGPFEDPDRIARSILSASGLAASG